MVSNVLRLTLIYVLITGFAGLTKSYFFIFDRLGTPPIILTYVL